LRLSFHAHLTHHRAGCFDIFNNLGILKKLIRRARFVHAHYGYLNISEAALAMAAIAAASAAQRFQ
jgi:hypothetical protein